MSPERKTQLEALAGWSWDTDEDAMAQWIKECCIIDRKEREQTSELYKSYCKHTAEHGEMPVSQKRLTQCMGALGLGRFRSAGGRHITGLRLRTPTDPPGDCGSMDFRPAPESAGGTPLADEEAMAQWMKECCIIGSKVREQTSELYKTYCKHIEEHGKMPVSHKRFTQRMEALGFGRFRSAGGRYITGIRLRMPDDPPLGGG